MPKADVTQADHNGDHKDHKGEHGSGGQEPWGKGKPSVSVKRIVTMLCGWRLPGSEPGQGSGSVGG